MIGSHPTRHNWTLWQAVLIAPATAVLVGAFLVLCVATYASETVKDWTGQR